MALKNNKTEATGASVANLSCFRGFCRFHQRRHQDTGLMALMAFLTF